MSQKPRAVHYLTTPPSENSSDWVITNPPFRLAEEFIQRSLTVGRRGVAILVRTAFVESVGRHQRLFGKQPFSTFMQFIERVPMVKGRLDRKASTATSYSWLVWEKGFTGVPVFLWIPQCRKSLEHDTDYDQPLLQSNHSANQ